MTEDNQTCIGLNFMKQNALHCPVNNTKNYFCQAQKVELSESLGYSASGHCMQGVTLDQKTGSAIAKGWYEPVYCESPPPFRIRSLIESTRPLLVDVTNARCPTDSPMVRTVLFI